MSRTIKFDQDKVVKHSIRFAVVEGTFTMSIYVPRLLLGLLGKPEAKSIWVTFSVEEPKNG